MTRIHGTGCCCFYRGAGAGVFALAWRRVQREEVLNHAQALHMCAENRKLHASPIWLMFLILPIISAGYGTFNYLQNLEILTDG